MSTAFVLAAAHHIKGPHIDWRGLSPFLALTGGGLVVLLVGLFRAEVIRTRVVPVLALIALGAALGLEVWRFHHPATIISGALRVDALSIELDMLFAGAAMAAVLLSWRSLAPREAGHGEYHALLLFSVLGMAVLVSAQNLITLFLGLEVLSIPLYVLCASETRRESSLESGLKYLIIGSVGSATLVYGLALVYGATGHTDFGGIGAAVSTGGLSGGSLGDPMLFTGLGLVVVGFAFKASVAPFHQWTPDVYEGAPTPITAFMATATKAAALGVFLRFFNVAAIGAQDTWAPIVAAIAAITMIVGNVGALGQDSLKRMLGYSGVAQAGYMLSGVIVGSQLGVQATVLYLFAYLAMNMAAFAVVVAQEREVWALTTGGRETLAGDDITSLTGLGARRPWLAWPMTIGLLGLAGIPGTVGFIGKFQLIHALVAGDYTWLAIVLVVGSMISLGYYLRVVAAMWMRPSAVGAPGGPVLAGAGAGAVPSGRALPPIAGASPEADEMPVGDGHGEPGAAHGDGPGDLGAAHGEGPGGSGGAGGPGAWLAGVEPEVAFVALLSAAAVIFFGIVPSPLFAFAAHAGHALSTIF
jgi:NADH-quinone oxidoreductase subunit N